ncbi:hypothetical protein BH09SUM1_BH09SUM1_03070 [soil metagenome]
MKGIKLAVAAIITLSSSFATAAPLPLYSTSFEAPTYTVDATINGIEGWSVSGGTGAAATVRTGAAAQGSNFVELSSGAVIDKTFSNTTGQNVVWVEGYFKGTGSQTTLANATYPGTAASAIVHFSQANGIEFLNGTKNDGAGTPVSSSVAIVSTNWYKITIRLEFSTQTWDVWVNDAQSASYKDLGFKSANVTKLNGFKNLAQGTAYFDAFRVVLRTAGDANGDGVFDAADLTAIVQHIATPASDPIVQDNGDVNGDGVLNTTDIGLVADLVAATP